MKDRRRRRRRRRRRSFKVFDFFRERKDVCEFYQAVKGQNCSNEEQSSTQAKQVIKVKKKKKKDSTRDAKQNRKVVSVKND